jgi:signal transduction histidine kinase
VTRRLLAGYLVLAALVLAMLEVPLGLAYRERELTDLSAKVERDAVAMGSLAQDALAGRARIDPLRAIADRYTADTGGRVVVVGKRGTALVDSSPRFPEGRAFATRPEVARALAGEVASGVRPSATLGTSLLYVAVPVASGGVVNGAVRITYPTSELDRRVRAYWLTLLAIAVIVLAATAAIGVLVARSVVGPLRRVERAAVEVGEGRLGARAPLVGPPEVRELAASLNVTVERLEALVRSQEQFVADASHELRTPLTALRLRLENLERDVGEPGRESLEGALAEADRLGRLVTDLLALARADEPGAAAEPVDVAALVRERVEAWDALAAERGVALRVEGPESVLARAVPARLEQVLDNLLANALDVSPAGGAIAVTARPAGRRVELHVVDEGPGLTALDRERAFDRFWRGRSDGGGSGLGLAIVRRLLELDGGAATLRAAPGGGIDATVELPPA